VVNYTKIVLLIAILLLLARNRGSIPNTGERFISCKACRQVLEFTSRDQSGESGTVHLLSKLRCVEQYFHNFPRLRGLRLHMQGQIYLCTLPLLVRRASSTDMRRVTTGIRSEKYVVRRFRQVGTFTYTNLDSTVQPTTHLGYMV
jgi:hypothetical protein